jgi:hypothetical protein
VRRLFLLTALWILVTSVVAVAAPPAFPGAAANYRAWTLAHLPGSPEGLAIDAHGQI